MIVALLAFSEAHGQPEGETVSGFQCVGINIPGLHLFQISANRRRVPLDSRCAKGDAKGVARVSGIIYMAWPPVVEDRFVKTMSYGGKIGWLVHPTVIGDIYENA